MNVVPENNWEFYSYQTEQGTVVVGFHTDADKIDQASLPFCARVIIPIKHPQSHGGPSREEAGELWALEDGLAASLSSNAVPCKMLGRLTHGGVRELVFQVHDWDSFRPHVGRWMMQHEGLEIDVSEHDGWGFFFEAVWPSPTAWMLIFDRRVVDQLVQSGSDPNKQHSLEFVFRGPSSALDQMRLTLLDQGYSLVEWKPAEDLLVMAKVMTLELGPIYDASLSHKAECERLGIEYDGWGCSIVE